MYTYMARIPSEVHRGWETSEAEDKYLFNISEDIDPKGYPRVCYLPLKKVAIAYHVADPKLGTKRRKRNPSQTVFVHKQSDNRPNT